MPPTGIFLIHDDGDLVEMTERPYDSESLLQELLERHPALLAGDQVDSVAPRRWFLVSPARFVPVERRRRSGVGSFPGTPSLWGAEVSFPAIPLDAVTNAAYRVWFSLFGWREV
jgi:hypothetical protein